MEHAGFDIARRLANMCSLFRSFLDHFEGYFVRVHGKQSRHYQDWKRSTSLLELLNEWDQSFQNIINFANEVRIKETHQHAQEIANLRGSLKIGSSGKIALIWFPHVETKPEKLNFSLDWLPEITARLVVEEANSR